VKILVTGGAGFIGSHLVDRLVQEGHEVVVVDNLSTGKRRNLNRAAEFYKRDVQGSRMEGVFRRERPVVLIHLAAQMNIRRSVEDPLFDAQVNILGTLNVLEACARESVPKVVLASSFYVYDGLPVDGIVNESSRLNVSGMELFGSLKVTAEQLVQAYSKKAGLRFAILRFGSAYGLGAGSNLIQTFLDAGLRGESPEVWGVGLRLNQYTHVNDIARGAVAALPSDNEIFNLISPEETSTGEIALMLREIFGFGWIPGEE